MRVNPFGNLELAYSDARPVLQLGGEDLGSWDRVLVVEFGPDDPAPYWTLGMIEFETHSGIRWPQLHRAFERPRPVHPFDRFALLPSQVVEFLRLGKQQFAGFKRVAELSAAEGGDPVELEKAKVELAATERLMLALYASGLELDTIIVDLRDILLSDEKDRHLLRASWEFLKPKAGSQVSCFWAHRCRYAFAGAGPACSSAGRGDCFTFRPVERPWPRNEVHPIGSGNSTPGCFDYEQYLAQLGCDAGDATAGKAPHGSATPAGLEAAGAP
jgi:hypothetical protein